MFVRLILFVLPFILLSSALTNVTVAYGNTHIITTGSWTEADTDCGYYTSTLNGSASLTFNGVAVYVLGDHNLYGGVVHITIDGQPAQSVDLYGAATCGQVLFSSTNLTNGQHSINLELAGESPNVTPSDGYTNGLFVLTNFIYTILDPSDSTTAVSEPTGTLSSGSVPTQTAVASGPSPNLSEVQELWTCKPYGSNDCTFTPQTAAGLNSYALIVGSPASNCGGGTEDLVVTLGGSLTITDSWSSTLSVGLSMGDAADGLSLTITGSETWGKSQSIQESETVQMSIPPERQGALLAQVTYNSTNGTLQIGKGSPFPVVANQPQNDVIYVANVIPCGAQFAANYTNTNTNATKSSSVTQSMKPYSHAIVIIVVLGVLLNFM